MTALFRLDERDGYTILWNTNSVRRNALSEDYYQGVLSGLAQADKKETAAFILASEGNYFCSGGDLNRLKERRDLPIEKRRQKINRLHDVIKAIRHCPKPVIAAVEGGAAGAGFSLVLACDLLVAAHDAKFLLSHVRAGLIPDGGATHMLGNSLPRATASQIALLGRPIGAKKIYDFGLLSELTEAGDALGTAENLAREFVTGPQHAITTIKSLLNSARSTPFDVQLDQECHAMADALGSEDARQRIDAFLLKGRK